MSKRLTRSWRLLLGLTLIIPLLVSCAPAATPAAPAAPAPTAAAPVATEAPLIKRFAGETIRILLYEQVPSYTTIDQFKGFEDATGIKVEYELLAEAEMIKKETLDFSSHTGTYDVTNVHFWYVPQFAKVGYLEPLDKYVTDLSVPEWNSMSDFIPSYLESQKYEGKLYGLPFQGIVQILYYRKDLIKQYCNDKPPATMDELMACAKAITENGNGEVFGYTDRGSADAATFMSPAEVGS